MGKNIKGGAIRHAAEYYGVNSGSYGPNPNAGDMTHAYGATEAVSHGVVNNNMTGPNLHVMPNSTMLQTGGYCGMKHVLYKRNNKRNNNSNNTSVKKRKNKSVKKRKNTPVKRKNKSVKKRKNKSNKK
jgi:hypothetical protein